MRRHGHPRRRLRPDARRTLRRRAGRRRDLQRCSDRRERPGRAAALVACNRVSLRPHQAPGKRRHLASAQQRLSRVSAATARPRSTCATSPADGSMPSGSGRCSPGIWQRGRSSSRKRGASSQTTAVPPWDPYQREVVASNGALHPTMLAVIEEHASPEPATPFPRD